MIASRLSLLLGAAAALALLLAPLPTAEGKKNETARAIKKAEQQARKNGCILAFYAKGQNPWPSSRRNRPITMYTVIKNRGRVPYENYFLRFFKTPEATFVGGPIPGVPVVQAKPAQPTAMVLPDPLMDPNYWLYGPVTIQPGTQKLAWRFSLPDCAPPQKFNVTILGTAFPFFPPPPPVPHTCWAQEFRVRERKRRACVG